MLYREIIAVCSEIHTKHVNTLCGQNVELLNVMVHIVTTGLWRVKKPDRSLSYSQEPDTGPCSELNESSSRLQF